MIRQYYGIPKDAKYGEEFMSRFPILFQDRGLPMNRTCMCWGIECPYGWYHILEQLCTHLEFYNLEFKREYGIAIIADQVKEKYGTLRLYYHVHDVNDDGLAVDYAEDAEVKENPKCPSSIRRVVMDRLDALADDIIDEAERMTETTCADCGEPLTKKNTAPQDGYWITFLCKKCDKKRKEARRKEAEEWKKKCEEEKKNPPKADAEVEEKPDQPADEECKTEEKPSMDIFDGVEIMEPGK